MLRCKRWCTSRIRLKNEYGRSDHFRHLGGHTSVAVSSIKRSFFRSAGIDPKKVLPKASCHKFMLIASSLYYSLLDSPMCIKKEIMQQRKKEEWINVCESLLYPHDSVFEPFLNRFSTPTVLGKWIRQSRPVSLHAVGMLPYLGSFTLHDDLVEIAKFVRVWFNMI